MKVVLLCNTKSSELPNRPELIDDLVNEDYTVYFGAIDDGYVNRYYEENENVKYIPIIATRNNVNPFRELVSLNSIAKQILKNKIDAVLVYGVKNHAAMAIGAKIGKARKIICVVNGRGNLFAIKGIKGAAIRAMSFPVLKLAYALSAYVCFQNTDDAKLFIQKHLVKKDKVFLTKGSGVNLSLFSFSKMPKENRVLFLARITPSKGINEYIDAARIIKKKLSNIEFDVVGPVDETVEKSCLYEIKRAEAAGFISYHGRTDDVQYWFNRCRFFVYPSYYYEGVPRCVLQAMSVGRPIVTTNSPGCKDTVNEGINGFLVPPGDSRILAEKIMYLINNPDEAERMGSQSRKFAEKKFDVHGINRKLISHLK